MKKISVSALFVIQLFALSNSYAAASKEDYELQERCGKRAEEWFKREWGSSGITNTKDGQAIASYRNHYNSGMNKCFVLLTYLDLPYKSKKSGPSAQVTLFDINESKEYGSFFKFTDDASTSQCQVDGKSCKSEVEWKALVAPYMGD